MSFTLTASMLHPREPEAMTGRAQAYLVYAWTRHTALGLFTLLAQHQFTAAAFIPVIQTLPLTVWGLLFCAAGLICACAAALRHGPLARVGLVACASILGMCATGLWIGLIGIWWHGGTATPISTILMSSCVTADLIVCTQPLRSPFEAIRRFVSAKA